MAVSPTKVSSKKPRRSSTSGSGSSSSSRSSSSGSSSGSSSRKSGSKSPAKRKSTQSRKATEQKKRTSAGSPTTEKSRSKRKSPTPPTHTKLHVGKLTKNVNKEHMQEIFSTYGKIKSIEMSRDPIHLHLHRGHCYIDFEQAEDASDAKKYMDGGQVDGQEITVQFVLAATSKSGGPRRHSPPPRSRGGRAPSPRRMRSPSPRRRGPLVSRRAPSPESRKDKRRGRSSSSSGSN